MVSIPDKFDTIKRSAWLLLFFICFGLNFALLDYANGLMGVLIGLCYTFTFGMILNYSLKDKYEKEYNMEVN